MKALLVAALAALALSASTAAGAPNLCAKDGWQTAQASNGATFSSMRECAKSRDVFAPRLTIEPTAVTAGERFTLTATGFHAAAAITIYFAITGQDPYGSYSPVYPTEADGSFSIPFVFAECGNSPDHLTITFVDSFGVNASASLVLC